MSVFRIVITTALLEASSGTRSVVLGFVAGLSVKSGSPVVG